MQSDRINEDILYEIFHYFVAIDQQGPYTLILVCSQWEELVIAHTPLWSWIHVDNYIEDWRYRAKVNAALAHDCPLRFVLHSPLGGIKPEDIQPYVSRIEIFIVMRSANLDAQQSFSRNNQVFKQLENTSNIYMHWIHGEYSYAPQELETISSPEVMKKVLASHPQYLIANLIIDTRSKLSFQTVLSLPPRAKLLSRLVIFARCIEDTPTNGSILDHIAPIELPFLRTFIIIIGDAPDTAIRIIQACIVSSIETVTLIGDIRQVMRVTAELGHLFYTQRLRLSASFPPVPDSSPLVSIPSIMTSPSYLWIAISSKRRLDPNELMSVAALIECFPPHSDLQLELDDNSCDILRHLPNSNRFLQVMYSGECSRKDQFQAQLNPNELIPSPNSNIPPFMDQLWVIPARDFPYTSQEYPYGYPAALIPFVRRLVISKSIELCDLLQLVQSAPYMQEMDIFDLLTADNDDIDKEIEVHKESMGTILPLNDLISMKTSPIIASVLVHLNLLPQIRVIYLQPRKDRSYKTYYSHFERLTQTITALDEKSQPRCPRLQALKLPQLLPWSTVFNLARFVTKHLVNPDGFTIHVPSYPHPTILEPLVGILRGEDPVIDDPFPTWLSWSQYDALPLEERHGCYQCHLGGWRCKELNCSSCWRNLFQAWSVSSWLLVGFNTVKEISKNMPLRSEKLKITQEAS